jgi:hypothetical protein
MFNCTESSDVLGSKFKGTETENIRDYSYAYETKALILHSLSMYITEDSLILYTVPFVWKILNFDSSSVSHKKFIFKTKKKIKEGLFAF